MLHSTVIRQPFQSCCRPQAVRPNAAMHAARRISVQNVCSASEMHASQSRRQTLLGLTSLPLLLTVGPAFALIPDDSDEDLVLKLEARRKAKLAEERTVEREFLKGGEKDLVPVQRAVKKLAKSGAALEAGDLKTVSSTMADGWVPEFTKASQQLSTTPAAKSSVDNLFKNLTALQKSAEQGNLGAAKGSYVSLVAALEVWVADVGIAADIKGI